MSFTMRLVCFEHPR